MLVGWTSRVRVRVRWCVVFMLHRVDWRWEACGSEMALSEGGLVATRKAGFGWQLVSGGSPMTEGRHYWEAELISEGVPQAMFIVGAVRHAAGLGLMRHHTTNDIDAPPYVYYIPIFGKW